MRFIPKEKYKEIMEILPILCADLIIQKEGKILVGLRKNQPLKNEWWIPGGRVFKNERLEEAAIRKAKEEFNLDVKIEKELGVYECIEKETEFEDIKTGSHTLSVVFQVSPIGKQNIKMDSSFENYKWIDPKDSSEKLKIVLKKIGILNNNNL